jgi:hypothetical protein
MRPLQHADRTEWLYLFGSNATLLYSGNVLDQLAVPPGWILHLRYEQAHVDKEITRGIPHDNHEIAEAGCRRLIGVKTLISYVHQSTIPDELSSSSIEEPPADELCRFTEKQVSVHGLFPIRIGELVNIRLDGRIYHFWVRAGSLVVYPQIARPSNRADKHAAVTVWTGPMRQALTRTTSDNTPFEVDPCTGVYAALGGPLSIDDPMPIDQVVPFQKIVDIISDEGFPANSTVFALFHGVKDLSSIVEKKDLANINPLTAKRGLLGNESGYEITGGRTYALDISTYHTATIDVTKYPDPALEVALDDEHFGNEGVARARIRNRYDRFAIPMVVRSMPRDDWAVVEVHATPGIAWGDVSQADRPAFAQFRSAEWTIPLHIRSGWIRRLAPFSGEAVQVLALAGIAAMGKTDINWPIFLVLFLIAFTAVVWKNVAAMK